MAEENDRELDIDLLIDQRGSMTDDEIFDTITQGDGIKAVTINGEVLDFEQALQGGVSKSQILDFLSTGKDVRDAGAGSTFMQSMATGVTNLLGIPVDLANAASQGIEGGFRQGVNKLASINAPEGVDDYTSPNYDPDFYFSTDPKDFKFSAPNPVGGGQSIRDGIETGFNERYGKFGTDYTLDYADSPEEFENTAIAKAGAIVGENAPIIVFGGLYTALKEGAEELGKAGVKQLSKKSKSKEFVSTESKATAFGAGAVATAEQAGIINDNPFVEMTAELLGNLYGTKPSIIKTGGKLLAKPFKQLLKGATNKAATEGAINEIVKQLDTSRKKLLKLAKTAEANGNTELAEAYKAEAELYTVDQVVQDLYNGIDRQNEVVDPDGIARGDLPAGTLSGNPALMAIQKSLQGNPEFDGQVVKRINDTIASIFEVSEALARGGNVKAAEALNYRAYQTALNVAIESAQREALAAFDNVGTGAAREQASIDAQRILFEAKNEFRKVEDLVWDRIPKNVMVDGKKFAEGVIKVVNERILGNMSLTPDPELNAEIARLAQGGQIQLGELIKLRSILTDLSREATANSNFKDAGILDELANAALTQMEEVGGEVGQRVEQARAFSLNLNIQFNRYWNKDVLGMQSSGGTSIRDTRVLNEALGPEGQIANENFSDMQLAAESTKGARELGQAALDEIDATKKQQDATRLGDDGKRASDDNANIATRDNVIYPENTSFPFSEQQADGFTTDDGTRIFPPDGSTGGSKQFDGPVYDEDGNIISETELPDGVTDQQRLDAEFNRPEGATYKRNPEPITDEEFVDGASDFYDPNNNAGVDTPNKVAIRDEGTRIELGAEMSEAQENFLRAKVMSFKGTDGQIDLQTVEDFYTNNAELITRFPELKADMDLMVDAQRIAKEMADDLNYAAETGQLPDAIIDAVNNDPVDGYARLATEAKSMEQMIDFRNATIDGVVKRSRNANGDIDVFKLADELLTPRSGRDGQDTSLLTLMVKSNVISAKEQNAIGIALAEAIRIEKTKMSPDQFDQVIKGLPDIAGNLARIAGANLGVLFGRGDASLQAAAIGSQFIKNQFDKFPNINKNAALIELFKQPETLMGMLSANPKIRRTTGQAIKEYFTYYSDKGFFGGTTAAVGDAVKATVKATGRGLQNQPFSTRVGPFTGGVENEEDPTVFSVDKEMMELGIQ
tara:strand:+ start:484 stop:4062 length:3579 start_codon:yes stop_codon:yes gene_type:complete